MRIRLALVVIVVGSIAPAVAGDEKLAIDPAYKPKAGDRAILYSVDDDGEPSDVWGARSLSAYRQFAKSVAIKDYDEADDLMKSEDVAKLPSKTEILVVERVKVPKEADYRAFDAIVFRVVSGEHKGKKFWTPHYHVKRLKTAEKSAPKPKKGA